MSTRHEQPAHHGLLPDQVVYLRQPIWRGAVRQDPKVAKGNPYISGEYIIGQLNRAFGFDGWDITIIKMEEAEVDTSGGRFKATFACQVELTIYAGSRIIKRHGVGAHAMTSRNLVDVIANGQAAAYTKAIKSAAITFGSQFGLNTVRGGRGWQQNTVNDHPVPPNLGLEDWRTAWLQQEVGSQAGAEDTQGSPSGAAQPQQASARYKYPLQNLIKDEDSGGPTLAQLRQVADLIKISTDDKMTREALIALIKSACSSDLAKTRQALDEVLT
jgi:hypothetical protein